MKMHPAICFWLAVVLTALLQASNAQDASDASCDQVHAIAHMAAANSHPALARAKQNAGSNYRADIVYSARSFELRPRDTSAAALLLNLLPQDDAQHVTLMTLGDSLCDGETVAEISSLARIRDGLAHDFAKAVLLVPNMLPRYVAFASISEMDPHSDYAVQMQTVCRAKHQEFLQAVEGLSADKRDWFVKHIFNPDGCHAIALREAD